LCCLHLQVPDLGVTLPKTYHLGYTPRWAGGKTLIAGAPGRGAHRRSNGELDGIIQVHQCCAPPPGTTFIFGSWVCVADGAGDFRRLTIDVMKPKSLAASFHSELDEFVDNLDDLSTHGSTRKTEEESIFNATPPCAATTMLGWTRSNLRTCVTDHDSVYAIRPLNMRRPTIPSLSPHWKRTWTIYSKLENPKPPHVGGLRVALVTMV
jgi:hypothetical protein